MYANSNFEYSYSLRDVERRPVLCSFKRIEGGSAYQKFAMIEWAFDGLYFHVKKRAVVHCLLRTSRSR